MRLSLLLLSSLCALAADKLPPRQLIEIANMTPNSLREALTASFTVDDLKKGTAVAAYGPDFLWAVESATVPLLFVDDAPWRQPMRKVSGEGPAIWFQTGKLKTATSHSFHYTLNGIVFGGRTDVAAYLPDCYQREGVPPGKLSDKIVHHSTIYPGMESNYWIYVPADYDPKTPAALMVYQDGQGHINREGGSRTLNVLDNLIFDKKIPSMIGVFIQPGVVEKRAMRSIEYDTVDDRYARFLRDEILADVEKSYNIRKDAYSRGIIGSSSGGICAFNAAWFHNELFTRVISRIGSFTSIQWRPGEIEGGNVYPFKIRKEAKRNIRVWLQDGANDLENNHGNWPLQNLQMSHSLKTMRYDVHYTLGNGPHNGAQ